MAVQSALLNHIFPYITFLCLTDHLRSHFIDCLLVAQLQKVHFPHIEMSILLRLENTFQRVLLSLDHPIKAPLVHRHLLYRLLLFSILALISFFVFFIFIIMRPIDFHYITLHHCLRLQLQSFNRPIYSLHTLIHSL